MSDTVPPASASQVADDPSDHEGRPLYWLKTDDPEASVADVAAGTDVRVLLPDDRRFTSLRERLTQEGAEVRAVKYWMEQELVRSAAADAGAGGLTVRTGVAYSGRTGPTHREGPDAAVAQDAFDVMWRAHAPQTEAAAQVTKTQEAVPASWVPFLPHDTLNPAQAQAAPEVLESKEHLLVVAPTGAGKTTIGMFGALRAVVDEGRKAVWLVPQRSLTDELERELAAWRRRGLRIERLSGEFSIDVDQVRRADLWVTTTEKFEVLCRTSSLRDALAEVGCLIVDEVHLLGDPERGPVLEAVLARVRDEDSQVRVIGLSATVSNAEQVAGWLNARLIHIAWRPNRLTWQLPAIPASSDWSFGQAARTRMTNSIVATVTSDGGSVLVFCGSKYSVRSTALAIAASRGVSTAGVRPDDLEGVRRVCEAARVGLHYKDWEYKREAESSFRERRTDVLVATSTVAAGVNLPARAVVVRDTRIGMRDVDIATVQQMFGRAGRLGEGENAGWAFMIVDEAEKRHWQKQLAGGYTVDSQIDSSLADHVLAEMVRGRVRTVGDATDWWSGTFAQHQGNHTTEPLARALKFLVGADYCRHTDEDGARDGIAPTELGVLTTRVMVPTAIGHQLRSTLARTAVPRDADTAEETLIAMLSTLVPKLARAPIGENLKPAVALLLHNRGKSSGGARTSAVAAEEFQLPYAPGDLARAALLTAANSPHAFVTPGSDVSGVPHSVLRPVLEDAPRYLHWLGSQGYPGTVHPWVAIVAADLSRRVRWRRCGPPRGSGRLLWMCENMATPVHANAEVPSMWAAARDRGLRHPDWDTRTPPSGNRLDPSSYAALLRERVGRNEWEVRAGRAVVRAPIRRTFTTWVGHEYQVHVVRRGETTYSTTDSGEGRVGRHPADGAALFSWRGDYRATGWLADYTSA
ncbi:DEAD/DEAH box helicase [Streptomyces sp. NPDC058985]|uniref:DEAD/DEAH box helicase n=1 Tax=Streptomyces sp. NPDC058985 TaxID=3346684 RepID=UPI003675B2C5